MVTAVMMDTLQITRRLRDAGASEMVAEAMAKTFAESSAIVREDLAKKSDLDALGVATKADIGLLRKDVEALEARIDNRILLSENRLLAAQNRLPIWIGGMLLATIGATVTLIKALG